jgi:hypothetical protein
VLEFADELHLASELGLLRGESRCLRSESCLEALVLALNLLGRITHDEQIICIDP